MDEPVKWRGTAGGNGVMREQCTLVIRKTGLGWIGKAGLFQDCRLLSLHFTLLKF